MTSQTASKYRPLRLALADAATVEFYDFNCFEAKAVEASLLVLVCLVGWLVGWLLDSVPSTPPKSLEAARSPCCYKSLQRISG